MVGEREGISGEVQTARVAAGGGGDGEEKEEGEGMGRNMRRGR